MEWGKIKFDEGSGSFPLMGRCDTCGRFVARGILSFINHNTKECPNRNKLVKEPIKMGRSNYNIRVGAKGYTAIKEVFREYWEELNLKVN